MSAQLRIRSISRKMEFFTTALLLLIPSALALLWVYADVSILKIAILLPDDISIAALTPLTRVLGFLVSMIAASVVLYGLAQLRHLFRHYQRGHIFTEYALIRLRKFAWSLLLVGLLRPLTGAALSVLLSINNPPGQRTLALTVGSNDIALLFISGVFIVIAWIMAEGVRLADENAQII